MELFVAVLWLLFVGSVFVCAVLFWCFVLFVFIGFHRFLLVSICFYWFLMVFIVFNGFGGSGVPGFRVRFSGF